MYELRSKSIQQSMQRMMGRLNVIPPSIRYSGTVRLSALSKACNGINLNISLVSFFLWLQLPSKGSKFVENESCGWTKYTNVFSQIQFILKTNVI